LEYRFAAEHALYALDDGFGFPKRVCAAGKLLSRSCDVNDKKLVGSHRRCQRIVPDGIEQAFTAVQPECKEQSA